MKKNCYKRIMAMILAFTLLLPLLSVGATEEKSTIAVDGTDWTGWTAQMGGANQMTLSAEDGKMTVGVPGGSKAGDHVVFSSVSVPVKPDTTYDISYTLSQQGIQGVTAWVRVFEQNVTPVDMLATCTIYAKDAGTVTATGQYTSGSDVEYAIIWVVAMNAIDQPAGTDGTVVLDDLSIQEKGAEPEPTPKPLPENRMDVDGTDWMGWTAQMGGANQMTLSTEDGKMTVGIPGGSKAGDHVVLSSVSVPVKPDTTYDISYTLSQQGIRGVTAWVRVFEQNVTPVDMLATHSIYAQDTGVVTATGQYVSGSNVEYAIIWVVAMNAIDQPAGTDGTVVLDDLVIWEHVDEPETTEPETTEPPEVGATIPATLYGGEPDELYQWYNGNGFAATNHMYIEIVADGADDVGSIHVYQTDGVTGTEDMRINLRTDEIPAGTYTLKYNIKGSDLGNTDTASSNKFYVSGNADPFLQFRNVAGAKTLTEWTECSYEVVTTANSAVFVLMVSKYVNGADYYIDNVQLLDANGKDMLRGAGNFCTIYEGEPEPVEGLMTLDATAATSAYAAPKNVWTPMYPSGSPDSTTWPAWDETHYGEIAPIGYRDRGSLHLQSVSYKNAGVAIGLNMVAGERYTLGLWAKGNSNSGKVLALYANGDLAIVPAHTAISSDWSYYECVFTATTAQLNIVATDWGNTNIYLDNITLLDSNGVDLLDGYGDFCEEEYRLASSTFLQDFNTVAQSDLPAASGQVTVSGASDPALTLNTQEAESGNAMQATWSYDGTNPAYLHRYTATREGWVSTFNDLAGNYRYLRMWISNPSHVSVDVSIVLAGENTVNYFSASAMKLIRKDGIEVYGSTNNNSGYGAASCISVPKQFVGWLSIPLNTDNLLAAQGYDALISNFANVTDVTMEFRKLATTGEGDSSEYYYVLDDICLGREITGKLKSTQDSNSYADYDTSVKGKGQVKNIILMIGDGMGYGALDVARLDRPTLYIDTIVEKGGVVGEVATTNLYGDITDSAAAGTALATGYLTKNTVLGLTENLEPVMNLGEYMKQLNKKLGLVTTTYVQDATPAAFAAHTSARGNFTSIALDILQLGVDVVQGGGRSYMTAKVMAENGEAMPLTELAVNQYGYSYATTEEEMNAVTSGKLWGLYQDDNMAYVSANSATDPSLTEMTAKTFELLENENGFFAMIEGSQIDLAGHANSEIDTRLETLSFDDAVKVAMDYVDSHPDTLLIITADHETGGVRVAEDGTVSYYSTSHTDEMVPYYAYGAGAEYFTDLSVNTQINYAIRRATIGDVSVGASTVATEAQLTDTQDMTATVESGIITYTGLEQPVSISIPEATAAYAVLKYKTDETNLVGMVDNAKILYAGDGMWHISDILTLTPGEEHAFQPMSYIKGDLYNSIEINGKSVDIDYLGFFETYEAAAAFQAHAALTGATPTGINGLSMSLGDDLDMNFYVAPDETASESTTVTIAVNNDSSTYALSDGILDPKTGTYRFCAELSAAQMTDSVTFCLMIGEQVIETGSYTIREYADAILSGDYDENTKNMVIKMLNYGAASQLYFDYNEDSLANKNLAGVELTPVPNKAETELAIEGSVAGIAYYGASLLFRSETALRFYFEADSDISGCTFTAGGVTYTPEKKGELYYVEIDGINPQELSDSITLTVASNSDTLSVVYSPMNYIVRMSQNGSTALQTLLEAMYNYYLAACKIA